jgi:hypothetical protein
MPATLLLDTVARAAITDNLPKITRTGIIKGINTLGMDADEVFAACASVPGLPAFRSAYPGAAYNDCVMTAIAFEPFENNPAKIRVLMTYERFFLGDVVVTFVLQRQTTMIETATELHPADLSPLTVTWMQATAGPDPTVTDFVQRTARFRYRRPFQRVTATGYYMDGAPPADMLGALGSVNDDTWRDLPRGYWLYAGQSDLTRDRGNSYTITLELETQLRQDWSQYQVLEDVNGRYLPPDPAEVAALRALDYEYNVVTGNGITKVGLYPTADFGLIFGFGGIP